MHTEAGGGCEFGDYIIRPTADAEAYCGRAEDCGRISSASNVREGGYMLRTPCRCAPSG